VAAEQNFCQLDMFTDRSVQEEEESRLEREKRRQQAVLAIRKKYGKNAILKGMNLEEGATARKRNAQIGGHKA
jgi:DNA polymerase V